MGFWNIIVPSATTNLITNPSFEVNVTDGWTANTGTITRSSTYSKFGVYSAVLAGGGSVIDIESTDTYTMSIGEKISASCYVYIPSTGGVTNFDLEIHSAALKLAETSADATLTDQWQRVEVNYTAVATPAARIKLISTDTTNSVWIDAVQLEVKDKATTYIDGSLPDGTWDGVPNNSTTSRGASGGGGKVVNFEDDLSYPIQGFQGSGMPQIVLSTQALATSDGSKFQALKYGERVMRFNMTANDSITSLTLLHQKRQALIKALMSTVGQIDQQATPRILRYTGAPVDKEIYAYLDNGLQMNIRGGFHEDIQLQFISPDPNFYEVGNSAAILDVNDTTTFYGVARRGDEGWDAAGITALAGSTQVWSIVEGKANGEIYIGGNYTNLNSVAANDYFVAYNKSAGTYGLVGATAPNAQVWKVAVNARGDIYIAGEFTAVGAVANTDAIAAYNGSNWVTVTGAQTTVGGGQAFVYDMLFKENGNLVAVGTFDTIGSVSADQIAEYNGSAWSEIGGGISDGDVYGVAQAPNGDLYFCGNFTTVNGVSTYKGIAKYDGVTWSNLNGGFGDVTAGGAVIVRDVQVTRDGTVYAAGDMTQANGTASTISYIARWNGSVWDDMGGGVDDTVRRIYPLESGELLCAGDFTAEVGGTAHNLASLAVFNGTDFLALDIDALTTPRALAEIDGELWIGHGGTSGVQHEGKTAVAYTGTNRAYPVIEVTRVSGGTLAELRTIFNVATGAALYFNSYQLQVGETVTVDTSPDDFKLTSSLFGDIPRLLLAASDTSDFYLTGGNDSGSYTNNILAFVKTAGGPNITATMTWRTSFISVD